MSPDRPPKTLPSAALGTAPRSFGRPLSSSARVRTRTVRSSAAHGHARKETVELTGHARWPGRLRADGHAVELRCGFESDSSSFPRLFGSEVRHTSRGSTRRYGVLLVPAILDAFSRSFWPKLSRRDGARVELLAREAAAARSRRALLTTTPVAGWRSERRSVGGARRGGAFRRWPPLFFVCGSGAVPPGRLGRLQKNTSPTSSRVVGNARTLAGPSPEQLPRSGPSRPTDADPPTA